MAAAEKAEAGADVEGHVEEEEDREGEGEEVPSVEAPADAAAWRRGGLPVPGRGWGVDDEVVVLVRRIPLHLLRRRHGVSGGDVWSAPARIR